MSDYITSSCGRAVIIGGRGAASVKDGVLKVSIKEKLDFIWVKITKK